MIKTVRFITNNLYAISLYARKIAGMVSLLCITRFLSIYEYGLFSSYQNIITYMLLFANLGFDNYILVSSSAEEKRVRVKQTFFLSFSIVLMLFYLIMCPFLQLESHLIFALVILRVFFDGTFFDLMLPYFQASKKFHEIAWINIFYSIGIILVAYIAFIFKLGLINYLIMCIVLGLINFIQCSIRAKINYLQIIVNFIKSFKFTISKSVIPYIFNRGLTTTKCYFGTIIISIFLPKEQVALYSAGIAITSILSIFIAALTQQILPELINAKGINAFKILRKNVIISLIFFLSVIIFFIIFGKNLLMLLYGKEYYMNAYYIVILLSLNLCLDAICSILAVYITAKNMQSNLVRISTETLLLLVILTLILARYGMYGIILATLLHTVYGVVRMYMLTKSKKEQLMHE